MSSSEVETTKVASNEVSDISARKLAVLSRIEWGLALLLSAFVLFLLIVRTLNAGPLWRDECDSLQHATMPSFADVVENRRFTSFPILFPVLVRSYTTLFGTTDIVMRCFGLSIGILLMAAAWYQARKIEHQVPLLVPALIGLNANFFTTGLWIRGYGVGSLFAILSFTLTAKFLLDPSLTKLGIVFLVYLAGMQCLFFNGVLVPGIVVAAALILFLRREWKWLVLLLGAAFICGISYIPYVHQVYSDISNWADLLRTSVPFTLWLRRFIGACGGSTVAVSLVWLAVVGFCFVEGTRQLKTTWKNLPTSQRDLLLFAVITVPACVLAYYAFMLILRNVPLQRYFLALTCLIAAATSLLTSGFVSNYRLRLGRLFLIIILLATSAFARWDRIAERESNMDVVTRQLEQDCHPDDLIVVNPLSIGVSFNHYYHGTNRWLTVPQISDHRVHRYDLLQQKMMEFFPLDDVEQAIATTLKSGHRVWIVGRISITATAREPLVLAPAPDPTFGWQSSAYGNSWSQQLGEFIRRHAQRVDLVVRKSKSVSDRENLWVLASEGWRY